MNSQLCTPNLRFDYFQNGFKDKSAFDAVRDIAIPLGIYFQEQDDFIDLYGDPNITGKIGTDIQEGKCTWFAAQALTHGTNEQKKYFQVSYFVNDNYACICCLLVSSCKSCL